MIDTVAVVPHPPILLDTLAGAAAAETVALRAAVADVVGTLAGAADSWVAVGADPRAGSWGADARGTFVGFGADVEVALGPDVAGAPDPELPLPLLVAGLLRPAPVAIEGLVVPPDLSPAQCLARGRALALDAATGPVGLLVLGDGAATHTPKAPGALDPRAAAFDAHVAAALAGADGPALAAVDPTLAAALGARGRAAWQVLAGVAEAAGPFDGELLFSEHPYGVAYHVARWRRRGAAGGTGP